MNEEAQARLAEFYLCCAMWLRPDAVEAAGSNNDALLALARAVADEEVDAAPGTERPDRRCS